MDKVQGRKSASYHSHYNSARNMVTREVQTAKHNYERKAAQDAASNMKHFWAYVHSRTTPKGGFTKLRTTQGEDNDTGDE